MNNSFPKVPPQLLEELNRSFPFHPIKADTPFQKVMFDAGVRSVIEFLEAKAEEQERQAL